MKISVLACALCALAGLAGASRDLLRKMPEDFPSLGPSSCANTYQGMWHITDDQGLLCKRSDVEWKTGCCRSGDKHTCDTCLMDDLCCSSYEHCVSCCLRPDHDAATKRAAVNIGGIDHPDTGFWETDFEYCRFRCFTSRNSTTHESQFINERRYCFSGSGRPLMPGTKKEVLPSGLVPTVSKRGQTCASTCIGANMKCVEAHFGVLNTCNQLNAAFACEAGCDIGYGPDQPAYVSGNAPKQQRPASCLVNDPSKAAFSCEGKHENTLRLCPCM